MTGPVAFGDHAPVVISHRTFLSWLMADFSEGRVSLMSAFGRNGLRVAVDPVRAAGSKCRPDPDRFRLVSFDFWRTFSALVVGVPAGLSSHMIGWGATVLPVTVLPVTRVADSGVANWCGGVWRLCTLFLSRSGGARRLVLRVMSRRFHFLQLGRASVLAGRAPSFCGVVV